MNLSTCETDNRGFSQDGVEPHIGLGVDGYLPSNAIARQDQDFKYRLPLMSPSRGKIIRRHDGVEEISVRPNVFMPIWNAPTRGRVVVNVGGQAKTPMNSYDAGQVNVNSFLANSDISALQAAQFVGGKSARFSTAAGD